MNPLVSELSAVLGKELSIHEQLVAAAADMNVALKAKRTADVARGNAQYDSLCCQLDALEEKRLAVSDNLAAAIGCNHRHATIAQIVARLPADEAAMLLNLRRRLKTALGELSKLNHSNRMLLENGLQVIEKTFEIIINNCRKTTGYLAQGIQARTSLNTAVINRVA